MIFGKPKDINLPVLCGEGIFLFTLHLRVEKNLPGLMAADKYSGPDWDFATQGLGDGHIWDDVSEPKPPSEARR